MASTQTIWELKAAGEATPWLQTTGLESFQFQGKMSGVMTANIETSNDPTYGTKSDSLVAEAYSSSFNKIAAYPMPKFVRIILGAWTSGSVKVSFGQGKFPNGQLADVRPESPGVSQGTA